MEEISNIDNIFVYFINMDTGVTEQVIKNKDGTYTIFLNARLTYETNMNSYQHAVSHILNGDFEKYNADKLEYERHNISCLKYATK